MNSDKQEKQPPIPLHIECNGTTYNGLARPLESSDSSDIAVSYDIFLEEANIKGTVYRDKDSNWNMDGFDDPKLIALIGKQIDSWYKKSK